MVAVQLTDRLVLMLQKLSAERKDTADVVPVMRSVHVGHVVLDESLDRIDNSTSWEDGFQTGEDITVFR